MPFAAGAAPFITLTGRLEISPHVDIDIKILESIPELIAEATILPFLPLDSFAGIDGLAMYVYAKIISPTLA